MPIADLTKADVRSKVVLLCPLQSLPLGKEPPPLMRQPRWHDQALSVAEWAGRWVVSVWLLGWVKQADGGVSVDPLRQHSFQSRAKPRGQLCVILQVQAELTWNRNQRRGYSRKW